MFGNGTIAIIPYESAITSKGQLFKWVFDQTNESSIQNNTLDPISVYDRLTKVRGFSAI